jgi:hypothetical protein
VFNFALSGKKPVFLPPKTPFGKPMMVIFKDIFEKAFQGRDFRRSLNRRA